MTTELGVVTNSTAFVAMVVYDIERWIRRSLLKMPRDTFVEAIKILATVNTVHRQFCTISRARHRCATG